MKDVYIHMPYGSYGDQICFLGAARIYARRHPEQRVNVNVLPLIVKSYSDGLLTYGTNGQRVDFECVARHRVKHRSPDKTYVGTYLAAIGEDTSQNPAPELPKLSCPDGLTPGGYIAVQPYSTFARNAPDRDSYVQHLISACQAAYPGVPLVCVGRDDTRRDLKGLDYGYLGWEIQPLRVIQHARCILTPRSASAHIAAAYRIPAFMWLCGDGEDWHLDYPDWPTERVSVDLSPPEAKNRCFTWLKKGTETMGDVSRVLSSTPGNLQNLMHDRVVMEACENIHLHWRNVRIEMSISDAARMLDIFWWGSDHILKALGGKVVSIPLGAICPYNNSHMKRGPGALDFENESEASTAEHKAGVNWMVEKIRSGHKTWPIAVRPAWHGRFPRPSDKASGNIWQRLDGFKRYMAHKSLGLQYIDCFVINSDSPGCQDRHRAFLNPGETLPRAFENEFFIEAGKDNLSTVEGEKQRVKNEVELLKNGLVHVHIGDARLEFDRQSFIAYAEMIEKARAAL